MENNEINWNKMKKYDCKRFIYMICLSHLKNMEGNK